MKMSMLLNCGSRQYRWRPAVIVATVITFSLLTFCVWWTPVDVVSSAPPRPAVRTNVDAVRQLLRGSVDDEREPWPCSNSSGCVLTPSMLTTTSTARSSVYSRTGLDCLAMFQGHSTEIEAAWSLMNTPQFQSTMPDAEDLRLLASNCAAFRRSRGYFSQPLSREEADFPVAFSILAYDNIPQVIVHSVPRNRPFSDRSTGTHACTRCIASIACNAYE